LEESPIKKKQLLPDESFLQAKTPNEKAKEMLEYILEDKKIENQKFKIQEIKDKLTEKNPY